MTRKEEWNMYWQCTMGDKSHLNAIGKIVLFPLAFVFAMVYFGLDIVFSK